MATITTGTSSNVFMSNGTDFHYVADTNSQYQQIASLNARVASLESQISTLTFQVSQLLADIKKKDKEIQDLKQKSMEDELAEIRNRVSKFKLVCNG